MSKKLLITPDEHEQKLVRSFFLPHRQERYLALFAKPRRRNDVLCELAHFKYLDLRWAVPTPPRYHNPSDILRILKGKGAPGTCWAISEDSDLDGKELDLSDAIGETLGRSMGTFLSCIPEDSHSLRMRMVAGFWKERARSEG
jgi:hypothetical protein